MCHPLKGLNAYCCAVQRPLTISLLAASLVLGTLFAAAQPGHAAASCSAAPGAFDGGDGTRSDPYLISTKDQLALLHGSTYMGCSYLQTADITLTGTWAPIGDMHDFFTGVYDGGGHSISGLSVTAGSDSGGIQLLGLFGKIEGTVATPAEVKNLRVAGAITRSNGNWAGGLAAQVSNAVITNAGSSVDIAVSDNAGGLIGSTTGVIVRKSFATGDVTSASDRANGIGGLIGRLAGEVSNPDLIQDSYATGATTAGLAATGMGSLAGMIQYQRMAVLENVYGIGLMTGANSSIVSCFDMGPMGQMCQTYYGSRGGLIDGPYGGGQYGSALSVRGNASFWDVQTTNQPTSADGKGTGATTSEMKARSTFAQAGWDIADGYDASKTWGICPEINDGYPFLSNQFSHNPCTTSHPEPEPSVTPSEDPPTQPSTETSQSTQEVPLASAAPTVSENPVTQPLTVSTSAKERVDIRKGLPTVELKSGLNTLLDKPVTTSDGTKMRPTVRFNQAHSLRPSGDVALASRYWVTKTGKLRVFIGSPKPVSAILVLRSTDPVNGETLVVRKVYQVR